MYRWSQDREDRILQYTRPIIRFPTYSTVGNPNFGLLPRSSARADRLLGQGFGHLCIEVAFARTYIETVEAFFAHGV